MKWKLKNGQIWTDIKCDLKEEFDVNHNITIAKTMAGLHVSASIQISRQQFDEMAVYCTHSWFFLIIWILWFWRFRLDALSGCITAVTTIVTVSYTLQLQVIITEFRKKLQTNVNQRTQIYIIICVIGRQNSQSAWSLQYVWLPEEHERDLHLKNSIRGISDVTSAPFLSTREQG